MKKTKLSLIAYAILSTNIYANINQANITISSATKVEQSIKDVTSNVEVITGAQLEAMNISTLKDAITLVSGVDFVANGGFGQTTSVYVRGMSSNRVLVLIDGIRYNDITGLNGASFEYISLNNIKQIEIIKGAQSGIWGADASAGVINIITNKTKENFNGNLNIEVGSFNTQKISGNLSYKNENAYISLSSKKVQTNGFTSQAIRGVDINTYEDDGYKNKTTTLKTGFNINETNKINVIHTIIDTNTKYDGSNNSTDTTHTISNSKFTTINFNHIDSFNTLDLYAKKSIFSRNYSYGDFDGEVNDTVFKSKIDYNKKDFIVWGVDYKNFEHKNSIDKKYNNKALFITNSNEFKGKLGGTTILTESLRRDVFDTFNNKTTGKIGLKHYHDFLKGFVASANYGTSYNVPTLYNLYDSYAGNEKLNQEETKSYDISLEYKQVKITYFNTKIDDMISYDYSTWKYNNIDGTSKITGYELSYKKAIAKAFVSLNYTRVNARDKDANDLARRAKESLKLSIDYLAIKNLHLNLSSIYIGQRFDDAAKTKQTGKYTVSNFNANYKINKNTSIYTKIDNITNRYYQTVEGYATSPRAYYAGIKVKF